MYAKTEGAAEIQNALDACEKKNFTAVRTAAMFRAMEKPLPQPKPAKRGFAAMNPKRALEIQRSGGIAVSSGRKGRARMAANGRIGGTNKHVVANIKKSIQNKRQKAA